MLIGLIAIAAPAYGQQVDLKSLDKFTDVATNVTQMNLDESMLKSKSATGEVKGDTQGTKTLPGLKGLYLRVFKFEKTGTYKFDDLKSVRAQLKPPNWTVFFQSREPDEQLEIWIHRTKTESDGMLVISAKTQELVVINALGISRPADLAIISDQFGIQPIGAKTPEPLK
jgi:hypothetical protein